MVQTFLASTGAGIQPLADGGVDSGFLHNPAAILTSAVSLTNLRTWGSLLPSQLKNAGTEISDGEPDRKVRHAVPTISSDRGNVVSRVWGFMPGFIGLQGANLSP